MMSAEERTEYALGNKLPVEMRVRLSCAIGQVTHSIKVMIMDG